MLSGSIQFCSAGAYSYYKKSYNSSMVMLA